jgi:hypothetical protein
MRSKGAAAEAVSAACMATATLRGSTGHGDQHSRGKNQRSWNGKPHTGSLLLHMMHAKTAHFAHIKFTFPIYLHSME